MGTVRKSGGLFDEHFPRLLLFPPAMLSDLLLRRKEGSGKMANGKSAGCGTRINLDNREAFSLPRRSRCREIVCAEGVIWVTFPGDPQDYLLKKGGRVLAGRETSAVISAIGRSAFSLIQDDGVPAGSAMPGLTRGYAT
jgi:hypothetical protein